MTVDEAGTTTDRHFLGAAFATSEPDAWRQRIDAALPQYPYSLHFPQAGSTPDGRYLATKIVLALLRLNTDWYGHFLHIDRALVEPSRFGNHDHVEFNFWMGLLIKRRTAHPGRCYRVVVADRERIRGDRYMPSLLLEQLDRRALQDDGMHIELAIEAARRDRLVQIADLIGSATRQLYEPSGNPIKQEVAEEVAALARPHAGLILHHQRLYAWHWRPNAVGRVKSLGA